MFDMRTRQDIRLLVPGSGIRDSWVLWVGGSVVVARVTFGVACNISWGDGGQVRWPLTAISLVSVAVAILLCVGQFEGEPLDRPLPLQHVA